METNQNDQKMILFLTVSLSLAKLQAAIDANDPGASNWLSAVPLEEYKFRNE